jgi:hypothetical protein
MDRQKIRPGIQKQRVEAGRGSSKGIVVPKAHQLLTGPLRLHPTTTSADPTNHSGATREFPPTDLTHAKWWG